MESYVERFTREKREAAQKAQKEQGVPKIKKNSLYGEMQKEVTQDGEDTRGEGHEAQNKKRRKQ